MFLEERCDLADGQPGGVVAYVLDVSRIAATISWDLWTWPQGPGEADLVIALLTGGDQSGAWQDPRVQRRLLGMLFAVLAAGLGLIAVFSALEGGGAWVIALAAAVLAIWMGDLARRALTRPRA